MAVLVGLTLVTDVAVLQGRGWVGWTAYAWVWLLAHELGFWWRDARLPSRGAVALAAAGLAALVGLTTVGGYPVSMVGVPGERTNTSPPSLALVALAVAHFGLLSLLRPHLDRWLQRPRVWRRVVAANGMVMTAYLWHMTALAAGVVLLLPTGWFPQDAPGSGAWWSWRPAWLAVLGLLLVPLLAVFARIESRAGRAAAPRTPSQPVATSAPPSPTPDPGRSSRSPRLGRPTRPGARGPSTPVAAGAAVALSAGLVHLSLAGLPVP
jgi:hypothetical protein